MEIRTCCFDVIFHILQWAHCLLNVSRSKLLSVIKKKGNAIESHCWLFKKVLIDADLRFKLHAGEMVKRHFFSYLMLNIFFSLLVVTEIINRYFTLKSFFLRLGKQHLQIICGRIGKPV